MDSQNVAEMVEEDIEDQVDPDSNDPVPHNLDDEFEAQEDNDLRTSLPTFLTKPALRLSWSSSCKVA